MRMLVTAGPTREYIDPVRFLSNESSGRMGYAIARAARRRGHRVVLVSGPTTLREPAGLRTVQVVSALDMQREVRRHFETSDCLVMAAAVADFRPRTFRKGKLKKHELDDALPLRRNPDIVAGVGRRKGDRVVIGFALETDHGRENALAKMKAKRLDYVVLNSPEVIGATTASVTILGEDGSVQDVRRKSKDSVATAIVRVAEAARLESAGKSKGSNSRARTRKNG